MGNCFFSCLKPTAYVSDDYKFIKKPDQFMCVETCRNHEQSLEQLCTPTNSIESECIEYFGKLPSAYAIDLEGEDTYCGLESDFEFTISHLALNDHRLSSELFNLNLTEMSRDLQQFQDDLSLDSGFSGSRAVSQLTLECSALDMISIKADSLSRLSARQFNTSLYNKSVSFCFGLINMSLTNMPFLSRSFFNVGQHQAMTAKGLTNKRSLFSPKFMAEMKDKVLQKVTKSKKSKDQKDQQQKQVKYLTGSEQTKDKQQQLGSVVIRIPTAGLTSTFTSLLKTSIFRIYDVNSF